MPVAVDIARQNICRSNLLIRDHFLFPGAAANPGIPPPGEPVAARKGLALGAAGNIRQPVAIDIAKAEIVTAAAGISLGEYFPFPGLRFPGLVGNPLNTQRIAKIALRLKVIGQNFRLLANPIARRLSVGYLAAELLSRSGGLCCTRIIRRRILDL